MLLRPFHVAQNQFKHRWHWPKDASNPVEGPICGDAGALKFAGDEQGITCKKCIQGLNALYSKKGIDKFIKW